MMAPWRGRPIMPRAVGVIILTAVGVVAVLWAFALFHTASDAGSLDARVTAVGATVRCPICPEPIPLNDVQNTQAIQMRQFIRERLQSGKSEDAVRQDLVERYGPSILLAPPQGGFDLLAWLVPLAVLLACAVALLVSLNRWTRGSPWTVSGQSRRVLQTPAGADTHRYEEALDRELAARD